MRFKPKPKCNKSTIDNLYKQSFDYEKLSTPIRENLRQGYIEQSLNTILRLWLLICDMQDYEINDVFWKYFKYLFNKDKKYLREFTRIIISECIWKNKSYRDCFFAPRLISNERDRTYYIVKIRQPSLGHKGTMITPFVFGIECTYVKESKYYTHRRLFNKRKIYPVVKFTRRKLSRLELIKLRRYISSIPNGCRQHFITEVPVECCFSTNSSLLKNSDIPTEYRPTNHRAHSDSFPSNSSTKTYVDYADYIESSEWQKVRRKALFQADFKCEKCGSAINLNVHHITYERLGREEDGDLVVLCNTCHNGIHEVDIARKKVR